MDLTEQLQKAKSLAYEAHNGQMYGDKPYTYHLHNVASSADKLYLYANNNVDIDVDTFFMLLRTACYIHDAAEDSWVTKEYLLEQGFYPEVVDAIDLVTKKEGLSYKDYLRNLSKDELAWKVKVADTYSNLTESIKISDVKRVRKYSTQLELLYKFKDF